MVQKVDRRSFLHHKRCFWSGARFSETKRARRFVASIPLASFAGRLSTAISRPVPFPHWPKIPLIPSVPWNRQPTAVRLIRSLRDRVHGPQSPMKHIAAKQPVIANGLFFVYRASLTGVEQLAANQAAAVERRFELLQFDLERHPAPSKHRATARHNRELLRIRIVH